MQLAVSRCRIGAFVRQPAEDIRSDAVGSIAIINGRSRAVLCGQPVPP